MSLTWLTEISVFSYLIALVVSRTLWVIWAFFIGWSKSRTRRRPPRCAARGWTAVKPTLSAAAIITAVKISRRRIGRTTVLRDPGPEGRMRTVWKSPRRRVKRARSSAIEPGWGTTISPRSRAHSAWRSRRSKVRSVHNSWYAVVTLMKQKGKVYAIQVCEIVSLVKNYSTTQSNRRHLLVAPCPEVYSRLTGPGTQTYRTWVPRPDSYSPTVRIVQAWNKQGN